MLTIGKEKYVYAFAPDMKGVAEAAPGDRVLFETHDCFEGQIRSESTLCSDIDFGRINPATGPLTVKGAEKGDLLGVSVECIDVEKQAVSVAVPGAGAVPGKVEKPLTRILSVDKTSKTVRFKGETLPLKPMIGVIGVATASDTVPTGTPGPHGGNMDTRDIAEGATVWFTVAQEGAMLALGDCHALMGDGEIGCSGAEVDAKVTVKLDLLKNAAFPWPLVETPEEIMIVVSAETLDAAAEKASEAMVRLAMRTLGMDFNDALIFCSLNMDLRISQIVDPLKTVRSVMPKTLMPWEKIAEALTGAQPLAR